MNLTAGIFEARRSDGACVSRFGSSVEASPREFGAPENYALYKAVSVGVWVFYVENGELRFLIADRHRTDLAEMEGWIWVLKGLQELMAEGERDAAAEELLAAEKRWQYAEGHRIVRGALAQLQALWDAEAFTESDVMARGFEVSRVEMPVGMGHDRAPWEFHPVYSKFLPPELDGHGEPEYDQRVVSKKRTYRQRALSAARVYGPEIREKSLADAIFRTGETGASSPAAARASLSGLTKYGEEWTRKAGWLIYTGDLEPDRAMIRLLVNERDQRRRQDNCLGENDANCGESDI